MKTSRLLIALLLLISASFSVAAQAESSSAGNRLADTSWMLTSFGVGGTGTPVMDGTSITVKFGSDGRAGGSGGCNTFGADYRVSGNTVSFSRFFSTKRACLQQRANQQEQQYFRALASAETFRLTNGSLTIFSDDGRNRLNFISASPAPSSHPRYEDLTSPVALLASFYDAVNAGEYDRAYRYWEIPPGRIADFTRGYRDTLKVQLIVQPPTRIEGALGSLYAEVPTVIVATQRNRGTRMFAGCYVTRKSNVSSGNQGEGVWRVYRGNLSPVAAGAAIPQLLARACRS